MAIDTQNTMKVDLVIATYNRCEIFRQTIENVLQFRNDLDQITFVDNASQDRTYEMMSRYSDGQITCLKNDRNLGAPGGKNVGLRRGQGDVIIVMDDDAVFCSDDPINRVRDIFRQDPTLGIIQFKIINYQTRKIQQYEFPRPDPERHGDTPFYTGYFIGAGHAIRRELLDRVGLYPESFFYAHEEIDLSYRAVAAGYTIRYSPEIAVFHKKAPGGRLPPSKVLENMFYNRLVMNRRYLPFPYNLINGLLWAVKTLRDSKSIQMVVRVLYQYARNRADIERRKLPTISIRYLKSNYGRLYY